MTDGGENNDPIFYAQKAMQVLGKAVLKIVVMVYFDFFCLL